MKEVLETIANSGEGSFLAVLKLFGKTNPLVHGHLVGADLATDQTDALNVDQSRGNWV